MTNLCIDVGTSLGTDPDDPRTLSLRLGGRTLTRVMRPGIAGITDYIVVPPARLAFWLVDNWWRLRWECRPAGRPEVDWLTAHDLSSIGGGYVWPNIQIWGEGNAIGVNSSSDPFGVVGPVRYVEDMADTLLPAANFELEVDRFLAAAADDGNGYGSDRAALRAQLDALHAERADPDATDWRRLEAECGFDVDSAPDELMTDLAGKVAEYGLHGVEEAVQAAPGNDAAQILSQELDALRLRGFRCDFSRGMKAATDCVRNGNSPPWVVAEAVAPAVRSALGVEGGPVTNTRLQDFMSIAPKALRAGSPPRQPSRYGLRLRDEDSTDRIALRSRWPDARRFELARALGDAIWSDHDRLGPVADSRTARQQFQKAFAQSLLCPFDDLTAYIDTEEPADDDVQAAAKHFMVSERVISSLLVNKHRMSRDRLAEGRR